jgi:hypothetical protein
MIKKAVTHGPGAPQSLRSRETARTMDLIHRGKESAAGLILHIACTSRAEVRSAAPSLARFASLGDQHPAGAVSLRTGSDLYGFGVIGDCASIGTEHFLHHPAMGPAWQLRAARVHFPAPRSLGLDELYARDDRRKWLLVPLPAACTRA